MKASELVTYIKQAVREEVSLAINKQIKPMLKEILKEQKSNKLVSSNQNGKLKMTSALGIENKTKPTKQNKRFVKDPTLNEILNETANDGWDRMGDKTYTSDMAAGMGMQSMDQTFGGKPSVQQMLPNDKKHVEIPEAVEKALTRDYTDLIKAIDKKKSNK